MRNDALGAVSELAAAQHGALHRRQAAAHHLDKDRIRRMIASGLLAEPCPGVLVVRAAPSSWRQRLAVATLASGGGVASHRAAARLHGLDGTTDLDVVEVTVRTRRRLSGLGAVLHRTDRLDPCDLVVVDGIAATGLARTLADLGSVVAPDVVLQALDDARRRGANLRWLRETAERLHRPGQRGTGVLLRHLEVARTDRVPDSWFERLVEACLRSPRLPPVVRQHPIADADGRVVARTDLAFPDVRLAVEAHSRRFHFGTLPEGADEDRDHRLGRLGWDVPYVGHQSTRRPAQLLDLVVDHVHARAALLGRDPRTWA